jgi:phage gp16-like protein
MTRQTMFSITIAISAIPKSAADRHGTRTQLAKLRAAVAHMIRLAANPMAKGTATNRPQP